VLERPLLYLSDFFEKERERYFDCLKAVSCSGQWAEWVLFFLDAVSATANDAVNRIDRIVELNSGYRERVLKHSSSQAPLAAVELVMNKVMVSVAELERYAHCSYPTAKKALDTLAQLGIVSPMGNAYPARWVADELLEQAYER
jgi:Fic family protein